MESQNEKMLKDYPRQIFIEGTKKVLHQMEKSICKICMKDGSKGTGFFCKIPLPNNTFLPAFITNNHVINEKNLKEENEIKIKMNNGYKTSIKAIKIKDRFNYTNENYDITIIEIIDKNNENSYEYLEFDDNILNENGLGYVGSSIYLLHYPSHFEEDKAAVSYGILKSRFEDKTFDFKHFCSTEYGSSGSPILNLLNHKIIGIHKAGKNQYNRGLFLYGALQDFIIKYKEKINKKQIDKINKIIKSMADAGDKELIDLIKNLYNKRLISDIIPLKGKDPAYINPLETIVGYQLICKEEFLSKNDFKIKENWISAWHGTNHENLESILKYGFKLPGTKLKNGNIIHQNFNIKNKEVDGIKNWEKAIFASPNIYPASKYSNGINRIFGLYYCLIKVKIKPNSFSQYLRTYLDCNLVPCGNFPYPVDYIIYRITSEKNIILKSILFVDNSFLHVFFGKNNEDYILKKMGYLD